MDRELVLHLKETYPKGKRIIMDEDMVDIRPILKGEKGTVMHVDDSGTVHVKWDSGRMLGLLPDSDYFSIYKDDE